MISSGIDGLDAGASNLTVIGCGPAGITLALEYARLGKSVTLLESGGLAETQEAQQLSHATIVDPHTHYDMAVAVARRFGGTSNLWGGRCQPLDPIDFAERPGIVDATWDLGFQELLPFYNIACKYASCGQSMFAADIDGLALPNSPVQLNRVERFSNTLKFQIAHKRALSTSSRLDVRLQVTVVDFQFDESGSVKALIVATKAGTQALVPVNRVVIACGGLESTRLLLIIQRKRAAMFGGMNGPLGRYYMGHVIGEIADVTFANDQMDRAFEFFLDGNGSYVRRRMILSDSTQLQHRLLNCSFWPVVPAISDPIHGSGILSLAYLAISIGPVGRQVLAEAIRKRHLRPNASLRPHIRNVLRDIPSVLAYLPRFLVRRYLAAMRLPGFFVRNAQRRYGLSYHQEQIPDPTSRVWLNDELDSAGVPRLSIDLRFARRNAEALVRSHDLLAAWLKTTGLGSLHYRFAKEELPDAVLALANHGRHQIGTARMGTNRQTAVVDKNLRTFDAPNLYVASSAVMPTSGQASPTLTIIALAARLAVHLHSLGI